MSFFNLFSGAKGNQVAFDRTGMDAQYGQMMDRLQGRQAKFSPFEDKLLARGGAELGDDPMTKKLLEQQQMASTQARDQLAGQQASGFASRLSSMGMRGGVSAGSRERMATSAGRDAMMANQRMNQADAAQRMGIEAQGMGRQLGLQERLAGMAGAMEDKQIAMMGNKMQTDAQMQLAENQRQSRPGGLGGLVTGLLGKIGL